MYVQMASSAPSCGGCGGGCGGYKSSFGFAASFFKIFPSIKISLKA